MHIAKRLNTYDIEELYHQCRVDEHLRLPISMSYGGLLGVDASLAQLVITWARSQEKSVLHLYADSDNASEQVPQLARSAAGLAALIMCTNIVSQSHVPIEKRSALTLIRPLIEAMYEGDLKSTANEKGARPKAINLFSINNAKMEYIKPFYYGESDPKVHPRTSFSALLEMSSALMHTRHDQKFLHKSGLPALGGVLAELISNADEHSVTDVYGIKYKKGLRGTSLKASRIKKEDAQRHSKTEPEFARFIVKNMVSSEEALDFLEISIIDSGPGLAKRWLSARAGVPVDNLDSLSIDDEYEATLDCFKKHVTTKDSSTSGMGLHNAVQALNKLKAFVRLRTGRLCLYQTFQGHDQVVEYRPKRWKGENELVAAEGTVFTICIPVN
jgi:hypothetical protein